MQQTKKHQSFIIAVASGKGGVGKSLVTVNTAEVLVQMGYKVAVVDADLGLSNCAALINESVPGTVMDVLRDRSSMDEVFLETEGGYTLVTGADEPDSDTLDWSVMYPTLDSVLRRLRQENDFILIDTPAGATDLSFWALDRADMGMLIVVGEPTAISDVYRFCKFVLDVDPTYPFGAVVNFAESDEDAQNVLHRFNTIVNHFMKREFPFLGYIPMDEMMRKSVTDQFPIARSDIEGDLVNEFKYIASALVGLANKHYTPNNSRSKEVDAS